MLRAECLELRVGYLCLPHAERAGDCHLVYGRLVDKLYRREIERALPEVVERVEATMGVHASSWSIRSMKTRWGSCTPATRAIRINARLAAYPPLCLEMVVTHELVHLIEPSHNARFHALLDTYCPRNREASALLRRS